MMKFCVGILLLEMIVYLSQLKVVKSSSPLNDGRARVPSCKNPPGKLGEINVKGCKQLVCVRIKNRATWRELQVDLSDLKASIDVMKASLNSTASKQDLMDHKEMLTDIKENVDKLLNSTEPSPRECPLTSPCPTVPSTSTAPSSSTPEIPCKCNCSNLAPSSTTSPANQDLEPIFIGPGHSKKKSEILTWPALTPSNCSLPTDILPDDLYGYVATLIKGKVIICGGYSTAAGASASQSSCYLLVGTGVRLAPMLSPRHYFAAVQVDAGWWVMGGHDGKKYLSTTEVYLEETNTWVASTNLPAAVNGHCAVIIDATRVFMAGGYTSSGYSSSTYIYTESGRFYTQNKMKKAMSHHSCALFQGIIYAIPQSGEIPNMQFFSVTELTWSQTPISAKAYGGQLLVLGGTLTVFSYQGTIIKLDKKEARIEWWQWEEQGKMEIVGKHYFKVLVLKNNTCG